jgi:hypothetical protein
MMDLEEAYPGWGTGKAEEFISFDEYTFKDENRRRYSGFLYDTQVSKIQKDDEVTRYFDGWDRDWVRASSPPCIAVSFTLRNFESIKRVLKEKYNVTFSLDLRFSEILVKKMKSYDHMLERIKQSGLKVEFSPEIYEELRKEYSTDEVPLEDLAEVLKKPISVYSNGSC